MNNFKKISRDLLSYAFFSGIALGLLLSFPIHLFGLTNSVVYFFWCLIFVYPIISTWIYRKRVISLDFRSSFSVSFLTLLIAILIYSIFLHIKELSDFNFSSLIFSLTPLIAYSFLLASILKK
ncbi:MAG: hypothetical protein VXY26_02015 [Bacteroidota bacterium]|nr:hypothetical protein [Bacteroidota bacterium]